MPHHYIAIWFFSSTHCHIFVIIAWPVLVTVRILHVRLNIGTTRKYFATLLALVTVPILNVCYQIRTLRTIHFTNPTLVFSDILNILDAISCHFLSLFSPEFGYFILSVMSADMSLESV